MKYKVYQHTGFVIFYTVEKRGKIVFTTPSATEAQQLATELNCFEREIKKNEN